MDANDPRWKTAGPTSFNAALGPKGGIIWAEIDPGAGDKADSLAKTIARVGQLGTHLWSKVYAGIKDDNNLEISPRGAEARVSTNSRIIVFFTVSARTRLDQDRFHELVEVVGNAGVNGWNRPAPDFAY